MRRQTTSFKELMQQNKNQLLNDPKAMEAIDKRLDDRQTETNENQNNK